jgi:hypothetical protein
VRFARNYKKIVEKDGAYPEGMACRRACFNTNVLAAWKDAGFLSGFRNGAIVLIGINCTFITIKSPSEYLLPPVLSEKTDEMDGAIPCTDAFPSCHGNVTAGWIQEAARENRIIITIRSLISTAHPRKCFPGKFDCSENKGFMSLVQMLEIWRENG